MIRIFDLVKPDFINFLEVHIQGGCTEYPMDNYFLEEAGIMSAEEYNEYDSWAKSAG